MVDSHEDNDHNVVSINRSHGLEDHALPHFEGALEKKMNVVPGLDRDDVMMALKISGAILAAMMVSGMITFYVQGS